MPYNKTRRDTVRDARLKEGWSPYETLPVAAANDARRFQASMRYIWRYKYLYLVFVARRSVFFDFSLFFPCTALSSPLRTSIWYRLQREWIGLENFEYMFGLNDFYRVF